MVEKPVKACLLVIGDEVLEGSRQDKHAQWFAEKLSEEGVWLDEVRIIPDDKQRIIDTVKECSGKFDYVFTTGGLGPTHDDITTESIAAAFNRKLVENNEVSTKLAERFAAKGTEYTDGRRKMAIFPDGVDIIPNTEGVAPGFHLENVYVFPGIPKETQPMLASITATLKGGPKMISKSTSALTAEGDIAKELKSIKERHPDVRIGSYPFKHSSGRMGTTVKIRATEPAKLDAAHQDLGQFLQSLDAVLVEEPAHTPAATALRAK